MKKSILMACVFCMLVFIWASYEANNEALAISGCCKKRESQDGPWRKIGTDLERCKVENRTDNDNVFKKSGMVWWDMAC
ncbi:MAG: hypothetical protein K0U68_03595 [Gammaproteobacteria bacterium]|nr:hypothetical protein [Gammaproteobacteria bacterium]